MAPPLRLCVIGAVLAQGSAHDRNLEIKLAELEDEFHANHEQIKMLEANARRLEDAPTKSIYGNSRRYNTAAYTFAEDFTGTMTHAWLLLCGCLVMFMQAGFAMLEAGTCRRKFVSNILLKNLTDVCIGTLGWWAFGWSFAYSGPYKDLDGTSVLENGFGGREQFFGHHFITERPTGEQVPSTAMMNWFFQWAFASAAATIVSGGVAERVKFPGYIIYSFLLTSFIYPVIVAWTWGYGWLATMNRTGYMDFAGSGVVHYTGGIGALVGSIVAGPRAGRFKAARGRPEEPIPPNEKDEFAPHSLPLVVLGTMILWFGWYGFNCGSTLAMTGIEDGFKAAQVAMNTTIAASIAGPLVFVAKFFLAGRRYDVAAFCNGILAGLVSITAGCSNVECGTALGIGIVGAVVYLGASELLKRVKIDDPLDAFPIHGCCGAWGVFAAALFDWGNSFDTAHHWNGFRCQMGPDDKCLGSGTESALGKDVIAANIVEIIMITIWAGGLSALIFIPLKMAKLLVATPEEQEEGFDKAKHSPDKAYSMEGQGAENAGVDG